MKRSKVRSLVLLVCLLGFSFELAGCQSLAKKFVRKPKEENKAGEVVFAPEEYKGEGVTNQDLYKQYFLYWRTWQDELVDSLERGGNRKRQLSSVDEAVKNLDDLKPLMKPEKSPVIDAYTKRLRSLRGQIAKDLYDNEVSANRREAQRLRDGIIRDLSFNKIKDEIL